MAEAERDCGGGVDLEEEGAHGVMPPRATVATGTSPGPPCTGNRGPSGYPVSLVHPPSGEVHHPRGPPGPGAVWRQDAYSIFARGGTQRAGVERPSPGDEGRWTNRWGAHTWSCTNCVATPALDGQVGWGWTLLDGAQDRMCTAGNPGIWARAAHVVGRQLLGGLPSGQWVLMSLAGEVGCAILRSCDLGWPRLVPRGSTAGRLAQEAEAESPDPEEEEGLHEEMEAEEEPGGASEADGPEDEEAEGEEGSTIAPLWDGVPPHRAYVQLWALGPAVRTGSWADEQARADYSGQVAGPVGDRVLGRCFESAPSTTDRATNLGYALEFAGLYREDVVRRRDLTAEVLAGEVRLDDLPPPWRTSARRWGFGWNHGGDQAETPWEFEREGFRGLMERMEGKWGYQAQAREALGLWPTWSSPASSTAWDGA